MGVIQTNIKHYALSKKYILMFLLPQGKEENLTWALTSPPAKFPPLELMKLLEQTPNDHDWS